MSWGTNLNTDIYLDRHQFNSIGELDSAINDCKENIIYIRKRIGQYSLCTPKDVVQDGHDIVADIDIEVTELLEWHEREIIKLFKLNLFRKNFNKLIKC